MSKKSQANPPPAKSDLFDALSRHSSDDDPWKQSVLSTFGAFLERMDSDKKGIMQREKSMADKLKSLSKENSDLKKRVKTLEAGASAPFDPLNFAFRPPSASSTSNTNSSLKTSSLFKPSFLNTSSVGLFGGGRSRKTSSSVQSVEDVHSRIGNPFSMNAQTPLKKLNPVPPPSNLRGSTLAILPVEILEHILRFLFLEFHNHDRLNALAGLANPDPILFPQPWNPVSLLRVNRLFRELSFPLFYSQVAIDSARPGSLTLLEMNFIAASSSTEPFSPIDDFSFPGSDDNEEGEMGLVGMGERYERALESMGIKAKKRSEEKAKPVFKPSVRRLVLFIREERAAGSARTTSSAFYSSLQSLEEHLADKYAFLRPSDAPRRPLLEIIISTQSWLLPSLDVTAPTLTFIPRDVSTQSEWYSSSLFSMAERASKPSAQQIRRNAKEKLATLNIRLPLALGGASQARDLDQLKNNFHKLTYVRHLRLDFPFALLGQGETLSALEGILKSPSLLSARHFFDGIRTKVSLGVMSETEAVALRKRVEELGVGEVVEIEVDVIRV